MMQYTKVNMVKNTFSPKKYIKTQSLATNFDSLEQSPCQMKMCTTMLIFRVIGRDLT